MIELAATIERFAIAGVFRIAHGAVRAIDVVTVTLSDGQYIGRGECRPYARYDETPQSVVAQIEAARSEIETGISPQALLRVMPAGAARNAVDCALWDLRAKQDGAPVWEMLGLPRPKPLRTAYTLSIDTPEAMAKAAIQAADFRRLKIKIDTMSGLEAALKIMKRRPDCDLIIDANEALSASQFRDMQNALRGYPVCLIEQPVKASYAGVVCDDPLAMPIACADEALHGRGDLDRLWAQGYRAVNVKLDKCGGITEGLALIDQARSMGFVIMAGCMVGTSLAMAPMLCLASLADIIDLDGPALLREDRQHGIIYEKDWVHPASQTLWG